MQTPYFLFKPKVLETNYNQFEYLCHKYLHNYVIAYSVKTNSFKPLIKILNNLGSNFEVASIKEMTLTDISKKSKVFNGPCKTEEELKIAIKNNFLINVDSKNEIDILNKMLENKESSIGMRVSIEDSKFGFDESQLSEIIDYAKLKNLKIIALHFHNGTQQSIEEFEKNIQEIEKVVSNLLKKYELNIKYLDIGGGFPDKFQLKNINKSLEDYFIIIEKNLKKIIETQKIKIILEPGRCLVSDAFEIITRVKVIKQKRDNIYAILDVGINLLPKITLSQYKFTKMHDEKNSEKPEKKDYILAGPLLFNNDTLGKFHGCLKENDLIRIENVGAYCYNLAWEISYDKPKIYTEE